MTDDRSNNMSAGDKGGIFMSPNRLKCVLAAVIAVVCAVILAMYGITYDNPIFVGDAELCEAYRDVCLRYSHELMADCLGIPAHAQIIFVRQGEGQTEILLLSFLPPSRTKVWHSDGDAPYWEMGLLFEGVQRQKQYTPSEKAFLNVSLGRRLESDDR